MSDRGVQVDTADSAWRGLYRVGGVAAWLAALVFRRNLGAEVSLFCGRMPPSSAAGWFALLHDHRLLGLAYLDLFDVVDYALVGVMLLAVCAALWHAHKSALAVALPCALVGIGVYFTSNTAFSMLSLSDQYAAATTGEERAALLAAGQAMLALSRQGAVYQGTGVYVSFALLAVAGMVFSVAMLRSGVFGRWTATVGIAAAACDLTYCVTFAVLPSITVYLLSAGGLLLMIWHILIARRLLQLGRAP